MPTLTRFWFSAPQHAPRARGGEPARGYRLVGRPTTNTGRGTGDRIINYSRACTWTTTARMSVGWFPLVTSLTITITGAGATWVRAGSGSWPGIVSAVMAMHVQRGHDLRTLDDLHCLSDSAEHLKQRAQRLSDCAGHLQQRAKRPLRPLLIEV